MTENKEKNNYCEINVLSLCDGMSCGHIALEKAGFKVGKYFASEIKDVAIKVTKDNYIKMVYYIQKLEILKQILTL